MKTIWIIALVAVVLAGCGSHNWRSATVVGQENQDARTQDGTPIPPRHILIVRLDDGSKMRIECHEPACYELHAGDRVRIDRRWWGVNGIAKAELK